MILVLLAATPLDLLYARASEFCPKIVQSYALAIHTTSVYHPESLNILGAFGNPEYVGIGVGVLAGAAGGTASTRSSSQPASSISSQTTSPADTIKNLRMENIKLMDQMRGSFEAISASEQRVVAVGSNDSIEDHNNKLNRLLALEQANLDKIDRIQARQQNGSPTAEAAATVRKQGGPSKLRMVGGGLLGGLGGSFLLRESTTMAAFCPHISRSEASKYAEKSYAPQGNVIDGCYLSTGRAREIASSETKAEYLCNVSPNIIKVLQDIFNKSYQRMIKQNKLTVVSPPVCDAGKVSFSAKSESGILHEFKAYRSSGDAYTVEGQVSIDPTEQRITDGIVKKGEKDKISFKYSYLPYGELDKRLTNIRGFKGASLGTSVGSYTVGAYISTYEKHGGNLELLQASNALTAIGENLSFFQRFAPTAKLCLADSFEQNGTQSGAQATDN